MKCRSCGIEFGESHILKLDNMPKSAQHFPDSDELAEDREVSLTLTQCPYCGLVQLEGEPVPYYRDVIRASGISEAMRAFREKQFSDWVEKNNLQWKKILEIGCGQGEYLTVMNCMGVKASGIEHNEESVNVARSQGLNVSRNFIEGVDSKVSGGLYDGFYILNFLEHIPNPREFLCGIYKNLSEDGVGIIEVPNFNMILKQKLYSELIQDHLAYYTLESLCNLVENSGFEVIEKNVIWDDYILSINVKKRQRMDLGEFISFQEKVKNNIFEFFKQDNRGKKAVWGAGHQALANMSLLKLNEVVDYVVDSAPFKQGKFTIGSHIPIIAPDDISNKGITTILIMAGGYSKEILGIVQKNFPNIIVGILFENGVVGQ